MLPVLTCLLMSSCNTRAYLNQTASLGGESAGARGDVHVLFVNNTPNRALFTAGTYDPTDVDTVPDFVQFAASGSQFVLEANGETDVFDLSCARIFSVGGATLVRLVTQNNAPDDLDAGALVEGVGFSSTPLGSVGDDQADRGFAEPATFLIGADFPCNALLIVRLELNDPGPEPFRVVFSYIPSNSER